MGWIIGAVVILAILGLLVFVAPAVFGPAFAGLAPLLVVVAVIGLGGVWWRFGQSRIDPKAKGDQPADDQPLESEGDDRR